MARYNLLVYILALNTIYFSLSQHEQMELSTELQFLEPER